jgi:hypothetical protein
MSYNMEKTFDPCTFAESFYLSRFFLWDFHKKRKTKSRFGPVLSLGLLEVKFEWVEFEFR